MSPWNAGNRERPHHRNKVWQLGKQLVIEVYRITSAFPQHEKYGLASQLRRAAVSVPSNIAEGKARGTDGQFLRFLYMARGSIEEIDTQMELAQDLGYLDEVDVTDAKTIFDDLSPALEGLITKVKSDIADQKR